MTEVTKEEKRVHIFAVIGFVVLVVLLAWLAIQFVRFVPTAFSSLANIFEDNQRELREKTSDSDQPAVVVVDNTNDDPDTSDDNATDAFANTLDTDTDPTTNVDDSSGTTVTTPVDNTPQYVTIKTYVTPTSDPNGYTDLEVTFIAVGKMTNNDLFLPGTPLERGDRGAMQFTVKNIGTKTSSTWQFNAGLPNGTVTNSPVQAPLGPKEIATITIAFDASDYGTKQIGANVYGGYDTNLSNNGFKTTVYVAN